MKILVLPLLLAFAPLYEVTHTTRLGDAWKLRRDSTAGPVELSTNPALPICRVEMSPDDTVEVAHVIYKARELPNTLWAHVTEYGHIVLAGSNPDGSEVRVLSANDGVLDPTHLECQIVLMEGGALAESEKLERAILEAGEL
jgi:hypothetical protein